MPILDKRKADAVMIRPMRCTQILKIAGRLDFRLRREGSAIRCGTCNLFQNAHPLRPAVCRKGAHALIGRTEVLLGLET